ncbi:hypothetical protein, partial [Bittarella massiliensis (ex Durand et al. 2017)]
RGRIDSLDGLLEQEKEGAKELGEKVVFLNSQINAQRAADGIAPLTGRAAPWFTSKVLEKKALSYDCETHQIRWQITVNQNNEELTGVAVEDPLPDYL